MEFDQSRLPTGRSGWIAVIDHALSLGDLSELDYLELKGALSFEKACARASGATIARAVLGLANRMPDVAGQHLAGHGVILVGIAGGKVVGADEADPAEVRPRITLYVGEDGPGWDFQYVKHPGGLVLVVVVDPPRWGDPIHTWRRETTLNERPIREGEIFVRTSRTQPATSVDVKNLSRRLTASPHSSVEPRIEFRGQFDRVVFASVTAHVRKIIDQLVEKRLDPVPSGINSLFTHRGLGDLTLGLEKRTPAEFRQQMTKWRESALERTDAAAIDLMRHTLPKAELVISNPSVTYLPGVVVRFEIPAGFNVLLESDREHTDSRGECDLVRHLPVSPPAWEGADFLCYAQRSGMNGQLAWGKLTLEDQLDRTVLTWDVGDLRSEGIKRSDGKLAVWTEQQVQQVAVPWTMTATGVDHVYRGQVSIDCSLEAGVVMGMRDTPPDSE